MNAIITYQELSQYIETKFGAKVSFSQGSENLITISTTFKKFFINIPISLGLKIEEVSPSSIKLSHSVGKWVDVLLLGAIKYLRAQDKSIDNIVRYDGNHTVDINLLGIDKLKSVFKVISLRNITFTSSAVDVDLVLK